VTRIKLFLITWVLPLSVMLGACSTTKPDVVIRTETVEVRVPVAAPCVEGERPAEPTPLRDRFSRAEWEAMTTDQRENLSQAQALERKAYGDRLTAATAGCR
jgi:hypothetical protein